MGKAERMGETIPLAEAVKRHVPDTGWLQHYEASRDEIADVLHNIPSGEFWRVGGKFSNQ